MHQMGPPTGMLHLSFSGYGYGQWPDDSHVVTSAQ